eukprot:UC1_evm1s2159
MAGGKDGRSKRRGTAALEAAPAADPVEILADVEQEAVVSSLLNQLTSNVTMMRRALFIIGILAVFGQALGLYMGERPTPEPFSLGG